MSVTDRRTDRQTDRITITKTVQRIASHGKKWTGTIRYGEPAGRINVPAGHLPG